MYNLLGQAQLHGVGFLRRKSLAKPDRQFLLEPQFASKFL